LLEALKLALSHASSNNYIYFLILLNELTVKLITENEFNVAPGSARWWTDTQNR
jgi:hypothetical protein